MNDLSRVSRFRFGITSVALLLASSTWSGTAARAADLPPFAGFRCGENFEERIQVVPLPEEALHHAPPSAPVTGLNITLVAGPGLQANPAMLAAWLRAVNTWGTLFNDNLNLTIYGDVQDLGPTTLGSTSQSIGAAAYDAVRSYVVADGAANEAALLNALPTSGQLSLLMPPGFSFAGGIAATKADFFALGIDASALPDPTIVFNSEYIPYFDCDASDGISPGMLDFEAICTHELGHVLGFVSMVESIALTRYNGQTGAFSPVTLDLFRMRPGEGAANFTFNPRVLTTGDLQPVQMTYSGSDYSMSTGSVLGDGRQAGHWKDDALTGQYLGIMDPTLGTGFHATVTDADVKIFGYIGWNVAAPSSVADPLAAADARILGGAPNPFRESTAIGFSLAAPSPVRCELFDAAGRAVRVLETNAPAGAQAIRWDGRDENGRAVDSGVYLFRLRSTQGETRGRVVCRR